VPKRGRRNYTKRGRLRWERMRREKFVWGPSDIEIIRPAEDRKGVSREGEGRPLSSPDRSEPTGRRTLTEFGR
jgi:hypothetical protein